MAPNSSTNLLYVTNQISNNVSIIDTTTNALSETITVASEPANLVINSSPSIVYVANFGGNTISVITTPFVCFNKHTKILTDKGYIPIQDLRKGDLVKTSLYDYIPIVMIGRRDIRHLASKERIKDQLYKCSQPEYPEVFEPLIITGCHSILVDYFTSKEQREKTNDVLGDIYVTDNKYRLPTCVDERASVYEISGDYTVYHIALENDDYYRNYGIFANGLLVESCSKRYLKELSNMTLIE
jgi:YVTN family beta-propeller protein